MIRLLLFVAVLLSFNVCAQIPLTITEFDFEETPLINIAVGDLDANDKTDIYVIGEGLHEIIRLTNMGNGTNFISTTYYDLDKQPTSMGTLSLNGGDDMYYALEGDGGYYTLYGMDPLIDEKKVGARLLDTVGGLTQADLKPFGPTSQMLMSSDTAGNLQFLQIIFGSFNYIFPQTSSSLPMAGDPGEISSFWYGDTVVFYVPSVNTGELMTGLVSFNRMNGEAIYEDALEVFDDGLQNPLSTMTYTDTMGNRMMFVLDTGSHEIYKYVITDDSYTKTTLDASFDNPTKMAFGFIDGDTHPDLVVADGHSLWMLSNAPSRSGVQAELIVTYDEPIKDFVLTDFDGDGIDDIASLPVSRNKVLVARNDILSSSQEIQATSFGYWPNPATNEIYFAESIIPTVVTLISTHGQVYSPAVYAGKINLSNIPSGLYIVKTEMEGKIFVDKVSVVKIK